jgi:hypothetical protein
VVVVVALVADSLLIAAAVLVALVAVAMAVNAMDSWF